MGNTKDLGDSELLPDYLGWTQTTEASAAKARSLLEKRRYIDLGIETSSRPKLFLLRRNSLGRLLAARSRHDDFAGYQGQLQHSEAELLCSHGFEKSPEHPFSYHLTCGGACRPRIPRGRYSSEGVIWFLWAVGGARAFHQW